MTHTHIHKPYSPSWFDRLKRRVEALPGPWWLAYVGFACILLAIFFIVNSQSGVVLDELTQVYFVLIAVGSAYVLSATHFLDRAAARALREFRPALALNESGFEELVFRLTTMPARTTLLCSLAGVAFVALAIGLGFAPFQLLRGSVSPLWQVYIAATEFVLWFINGMFIFHSFRQLYLVKEIYDHDAQINLFRLGPLYALSGLTARTALAVLLIGYGAAFTGIQVTSAPTRLLTFAITSAGVFMCFLIPLLGIHRRLVVEKSRLLIEITTRQEQTLLQVHADMDNGQLEQLATRKELTETLELQHQMVEKIPTWPWNPETLNVLVTALLLPIVLFIIQFVIQKLIEP